jgi:hypothetical protein
MGFTTTTTIQELIPRSSGKRRIRRSNKLTFGKIKIKKPKLKIKYK